MKRNFQRIAGLAILALLIQTASYAQQDSSARDDDEMAGRHDMSSRHEDEIIIRHRGSKDAKVTIEIKDGEVRVNDKPLSDYEDSSLSIVKRRISRIGNGYAFGGSEFTGPGNIEIFPGNGDRRIWSYNNKLNEVVRGNRAQLGVGTESNEDGKGVKVVQVTKMSAAEKTGFKIGDLITRVDATEINEPDDLSEAIGQHKPGDKVTVTITRDGKEQKIPVVLGKMKEVTMEPLNMYKYEMPELKMLSTDNWPRGMGGFGVSGLKFGIRAQDAEDGKGVKVLDVDDESTAAKAGIKEGDVITRFDGKEINSVTALSELARAAKDKISVKVSIIRDGKTQELDVKVPRRLRTADL